MVRTFCVSPFWLKIPCPVKKWRQKAKEQVFNPSRSLFVTGICKVNPKVYYNILKWCNLNRAPMKAMTYKYNIAHSLTSHRMYVIKHLSHGYLCYITFITHKNDIIIIVKLLYRATSRRRVALWNLTMIMFDNDLVNIWQILTKLQLTPKIWVGQILHLFHGYLCYITFITHKNDVIISLSNFTEPLACGSWLYTELWQWLWRHFYVL